jgi:hypothetical protein
MASKDLFHSVTPALSISPATIASSTTVTGSFVDTQGYESVTVVGIVGTRTDGTYAFKVQDCDTSGGTYADLDPTCYMAGGAPAGVTAAGLVVFGLKDNSAAAPTTAGQLRRFLKAIITSTAVTTGALGCGAVLLLGHPKHRNVAV